MALSIQVFKQVLKQVWSDFVPNKLIQLMVFLEFIRYFLKGTEITFKEKDIAASRFQGHYEMRF